MVVIFGIVSAGIFTAKLSHKVGREAGCCGNVSSSTASPRLYSGVHDVATVLGSSNTVWFLYGISPVPVPVARCRYEP